MSTITEFPITVGSELPISQNHKHHELFFKLQNNEYVLYIWYNGAWIVLDNLMRLLSPTK